MILTALNAPAADRSSVAGADGPRRGFHATLRRGRGTLGAMSPLSWHWHRLRAMQPRELILHARRKLRQWVDTRRDRDWAAVPLDSEAAYPILPPAAQAPPVWREKLHYEAQRILAGRWRAFGHLDLQVDDPPRWHRDYLAGSDCATTKPASQLNHRALPGGADIKLIWELSRWYELTRLAMAAYALDDARAAEKALLWLGDWVKQNPPFRGWNWTSGLEAGIRLIQFTWMDALLWRQAQAAGFEAELDTLRYEILPPHIWFTWRNRSFGSSANNHLLGELAGLIVATVRWPALARWGASLEQLQHLFEREVLAQFAEDGGHREQALHYHLFSWELSWQACQALQAARKAPHAAARARLERAAAFFVQVQPEAKSSGSERGSLSRSRDEMHRGEKRIEPSSQASALRLTEPRSSEGGLVPWWDYGDSDDAFVLPVFLEDREHPREWRRWLAREQDEVGAYWLGSAPPLTSSGLEVRGADPSMSGLRSPRHLWRQFPDSGYLVSSPDDWFCRWDLSPLGYLATAAHGHLDALHLSLWWKDVAIVIDPGTGAYFAEAKLRAWLASREAHNAPSPTGSDFPHRLGPFLWNAHHPVPTVAFEDAGVAGSIRQGVFQATRRVVYRPAARAWRVEDACTAADGTGEMFTVHWQFAPGAHVEEPAARRFTVQCDGVQVGIEVSEAWATVQLVRDEQQRPVDHPPLAGVVSPKFRLTRWAPYLRLTAWAGAPAGALATVFSASNGVG